MTNCPFGPIENYRDIESLNAFRELTGAGRDPEELLSVIAQKSRDNARTPVQWDDGPNAGFTTGEPWIMVNPNYKTLNAASEARDPDSVLNWFKALIRLRRESEWRDAVVYNSFRLLDPEHEQVFAYLRPGEETTLLVVCNLSAEKCVWTLPEDLPLDGAKLLLCSGPEPKAEGGALALAPWQAAVWAR